MVSYLPDPNAQRRQVLRFSIFTGLLFLLLGNTLFAQVPNSGRILTEANLYLSVADWTDIWINGQQLVDTDPQYQCHQGLCEDKAFVGSTVLFSNPKHSGF